MTAKPFSGSGTKVAGPGLRASDFSKLMNAVGLFERNPSVAVAVSGGSDSMALCLLTDAWARNRGGRAVALLVDHGLRHESAEEAQVVAGWLRARNVEVHILTWSGEKPKSRIQELAREARYRLLGDWCRQHGLRHLALGHQQEDQAETFLLRLSRGSGEIGLAGMSAILDLGSVRVIRPLLRVPRGRLVRTLLDFDQPWIEDPSNRNRTFARVRARDWLAALDMAGVAPYRFAGLAASFGKKRIETEVLVSRLLSEACRMEAAGYAWIEAERLVGAPEKVLLHALGQLARTIGGRNYPPGDKKLVSIAEWVAGAGRGNSRTLSGCRFVRKTGGMILVCRENRRLPDAQRVRPGAVIHWDRRFRVELRAAHASGDHDPSPGPCELIPLGRDGWRDIVGKDPGLRETPIPYPARLTLPAARDESGIREVPFLGYFREDGGKPESLIEKVEFEPTNALSPIGFCLACDVSSTI
ncbi:MAG: tRNA lysidine(34) synthetase TilS [Rhodospirillales bacterium]|nr:tRNA lysidine(34) synthetase TilS [Rhodospirillales bacterium]